ncbi:MAG: hypothetical protein AAFQ62_00505 [Pseudomonadota bacterium]
MQEDPNLPDLSAKGIARDVGKELASGAKALLVWTFWGAAIGGVAGAGVGLFYFGTEGLAILALGGLVAGAIIGFGIRFWAETF